MTRAIVILVVGVGCGVAGYLVASPPAVAIGGILVAALLGDGVRFFVAESRDPMAHLARSADPNPCSVGQTLTVRVVPLVDHARARGGRRAWAPETTTMEETVPVPLVPVTKVRGVDPRDRYAGLVYDLSPAARGQWTLGPCFATRTSALGLWKAKLTDASTCQITVWPRTVAVGIPMGVADRDGEAQATRFVHPHQDNATVRQYNPGDDLRRVHWRSSARLGELMTRADEPTDSDRSWVGLILAPGTAPDVQEVAISLAASWIVGLDTAGFEVSLACGGLVRHGSAASQLTRLAVLTNEQAGLPLPQTSPDGASLLIVTQSAAGPISAESLVHPSHCYDRAAGFSSAVAVVLSDSVDDARIVEAAGWSVLLLGSRAGLEEASTRLGQVLAPRQTTGSR
ncbi:MAG: DUF58 domain-containing protein [Propionibacteriaceae bacterium]|nr:DUF58 domain-containing protein [Propionibacteriaceae bacterium]